MHTHEIDQWINGDLAWEDLSVEAQRSVDDDAMKAEPVAEMELIHKSVAEKRFTLGPWYIPNRLDAHNEWTDADELQAGLWDYVRKGDRGIRLQHNRDIVAGEWVEAMQLPVPMRMQKAADGGDVEYPEGTVFLGVVWKPWAWDLVKNGKIKGFSIGGSSARLPIEPVSKAVGFKPMFIPALIRVSGKSFAVRPDGGGVRVSSGSDAVVFDPYRADVVAKSVSGDQFADAKTMVAISKAILTGDVDAGMWADTGVSWVFVKAKFSSRSEAARYAAHVRWANKMGETVMGASEFSEKIKSSADYAMMKLKQKRNDLASKMEFKNNGLPVGPLGLPTSPEGKSLYNYAPSLGGHVDFDALGKFMLARKGQPGFGFNKQGLPEEPPYDALRRFMTPERRALHDAIVDAHLAGKTTRELGGTPEYTWLGGGGASGKTSILESGDATVPTRVLKDGRAVLSGDPHSVEINADEIKELLPEFLALTKGGEKKVHITADGTEKPYELGRSTPEARFASAGFTHEESSILAKRINSEAVFSRLDIVMDGTADGKPGAQAKKIETAHNNGYKTRLIMVTVPTEMAIKRSDERGITSGRKVPEFALRDAHVGASARFKETAPLYDSYEAYDNSGRPPVKFASKNTKRGRVTIQNEALYDAFLAKANESLGEATARIEPWKLA
jgi:hypothetical protein